MTRRLQRRLNRRWLPWALLALVLLVWAGVTTLVLLLAWGFISTGRSDGESVTIDDHRLGIEIELPEGFAITDIRPGGEVEGCPTALYRLAAVDDHRAALTVTLIPADCRLPEEQRVLNGRHGVYTSIEDVPEPIDVRTVRTEIGQATVFSQEYVECTNSCTTTVEPVAIIAVRDPVDPDYPVLMLRGDGDTIDREALEEALGSIERPE